MPNLAQTVANRIDRFAGGHKLNIGMVFQGNRTIPEAMAAFNHRILILGNRFRLLYKLDKRLKGDKTATPLIVEAQFEHLPVRPQCLDALILTRGLPLKAHAMDNLKQLRLLLKDEGLLVWPHPTTEGLPGKLGRLLSKMRLRKAVPLDREAICAIAMESGFTDIGQDTIQGTCFPWILTTALAGSKPWNDAGKSQLPILE